MSQDLKETIKQRFNFLPNHNQYREIERLIFEITRQKKISISNILNYLIEKSEINKYTGKDKFFALKETLLQYRFPLSFNQPDFKDKRVFLNKVKSPLKNNWSVSGEFKPLTVFFEKKAKNSYLIKKIEKKFPNSKIREIPSLKEYIKQNRFQISELKKPVVFIVKEKYDFLKPCPCTKNHLSCGYWIFNLGFGCPFDCSYCYLQQYTNSPGIILPANLKLFFNQFDKFNKSLKNPVRIGTGEFSDSLALDDITDYSLQLIPYFRNKKVLFELKTKSNKIQNILKEKPSSNIIISWSLNPEKTINSEEEGSNTLNQRLKAAQKIQKAGFKIGFHLDPIIYSQNWQNEYKTLIKKIYTKLTGPFAWISLGTLRCNRKLKRIAERRFPKSNIFYGELFLGEDQKLRYPKFLRKAIYTKILGWIREFDLNSPVYLCMEDKDVWKAVNSRILNQKQTPLTLRF